jgi:hypothetical protein
MTISFRFFPKKQVYANRGTSCSPLICFFGCVAPLHCTFIDLLLCLCLIHYYQELGHITSAEIMVENGIAKTIKNRQSPNKPEIEVFGGNSFG